MSKFSEEIVDNTVKEYLVRARSIEADFDKAKSANYEKYLDRVIEVAKMIQKEEHSRLDKYDKV